jgi:hypothetical protein
VVRAVTFVKLFEADLAEAHRVLPGTEGGIIEFTFDKANLDVL